MSTRSVVLRFEVPGEAVVPMDAKVAGFGYQPAREAWSVWMVVPELVSFDGVMRRFDVVATGEAFEGEHVATAIMPDDFHVFHLVEKP